jgi:hypothetical protein
MSSKRRSTDHRGFSLGKEASRAIDNYADRHNMTKSMVVEKAVLEYTGRERTARIEQKVDEILDCLGGEGAGTLGEPDTHTQTDNQTTSERGSESGGENDGSSPQSDGGIAVDSSTGGRPGVFDSLEDYTPDYPGDCEISREALKEAPVHVRDGLVINPDHVDYTTLQSKGVQVAVKTAVCAGILRYNYSGGITKEQIKKTASEALGGSRNASRHFDAITQYLCESPLNHPELDADDIQDSPKQLRKKLCLEDDVYAPSDEYIEEEYYGYYFADTVSKIRSAVESGPTQSNMITCNGGIGFLRSKRAKFIKHSCGSESEFLDTYHDLLGDVLELQESAPTDFRFSALVEGSEREVGSIEEFNQVFGE